MTDSDYGAPYYRLREAAKQLELAAERLEDAGADVDVEQLRADAARISAVADELSCRDDGSRAQSI